MQNLICFQTLTDSSREFVFKRERKIKNKDNCICAEEISFFVKIQIFFDGKFVVRDEPQKEEMQNLILFQIVTVSSDEFGFKREEKMKNKDNFICVEEISFCEN